MANCLFITWDGPNTSYLEGLFLPIFDELAEHGHNFHILQFTWGSSEQIESTASFCRAAQIPYRSVKISRRLGPAGPFLSAVRGARHIGAAIRDWKIDTLMPRSLMPAIATLSMRNQPALRIIFDADGFVADERVDFAGLSPKSISYRILRDVEAQMVRVADIVLTRTDAAISILLARAGSGTDPAKFRVVTNGRRMVPLEKIVEPTERNGPVVGYIGTIGPQ